MKVQGSVPSTDRKGGKKEGRKGRNKENALRKTAVGKLDVTIFKHLGRE